MQNRSALPEAFLRFRRRDRRLNLAFGGKGVVAVAVFFPDLAVFTVDQQFRALIFGYGAPGIDGLALGGMDAADAGCAFATNCPSIWMGYNMVVGFSGHVYTRTLLFVYGCVAAVRHPYRQAERAL